MYEKTYNLRKAGVVLYDKERGNGFVTEENRQQEELLQLAELNTGFDVPYWYRGEHVTEILSDEQGCYVDSKAITQRIGADQNRLIPLCYKADVPSTGNYAVEVELYGKGDILVFAGARRLVYKESVPEMKVINVSFVLNVCEIIPRGKTCLYENTSVNIAVLGQQVKLSRVFIKQVNCPTVYIAGDSTVTDQSAEYPYSPGTSYAGWGQMIGYYLPKSIAVSNHSHSGLTVESFRSEGHYAVIQAHMKPGDYLLIQFGHNDQKLMHLKAKEGYRDGLVAYIEETVSRGAYPIIVTPLARNSWKADDGTYNDLLADYAKECIAIGKQFHIPVIDLHARSMDFVIKKGLEGAKPFFFPKDFTHTNDYGAYKMAGFVVEDYLEKAKSGWADAYTKIAGEMAKYAMAKCAMIHTIVPAWEPENSEELPEIPEQYKNVPNPEQGMALFDDLERPDEVLTRVEALELVIKAARFFPTNVFNDIYDDIVGHEWYAGTVQCAYQNGIILPQMVTEKRFEPDKAVTLEEFLVFIMSGYKSRKELPNDKPCVFDNKCTSYCMPFVRAACALGVISEGDVLKETITRKHAAEICKTLNI